MIFKIEYNRLIALLLPMSLRRPLIFGLLRAGVGQVEAVYNKFTAARKGHIFRLTHNGQVCYLRAMLNEHFGAGFEIENVKEGGEWLYTYAEKDRVPKEEEGRVPVAADENDEAAVPAVYSEYDLNAAQNTFRVLVPQRFWARLPEIEEMVDKYKLVTKRADYISTSDPVGVWADSATKFKTVETL